MPTAAATAAPRRVQIADGRMMPYRFTVEQYNRMIESGVLANARCELLEGMVVEKVTHYPPHDGTVLLLQLELSALLPEGWVPRIQCSISLADSQPEPDVVIAKAPAHQYLIHHPYPRDIALVIEVAESSLPQDRVDKQRVYAAARLPEYWIVKLVDRQIEVYTQPRAGRSPTYRRRKDYRPGETVPVVLAGTEVGRLRVRDLFPSSPS